MTARTPRVQAPEDSDGLDELLAEVEADPSALAAKNDAARRRSFLTGMRDVRKAANLTQGPLAKKMGTTQPAVSELESGRIDPHLRTLQRFARACNRRFDFAMVDESIPVFDETMAQNLWQWVELNMLSPLLTAIAIGPDNQRTLEMLSKTVRFPPSIVKPILTSLETRGWLSSVSSDPEDPTYSLGEDAAYIIGVSIERDRVVGVLINLHGDVIGGNRTAGHNTSRASVIDAAVDIVAQLYYARGDHEILGVGVSIAGVVTADTGTVNFAPDLRSDDDLWDNVPLESELQAAMQNRVDDQRVRVAVENDANCLAMLEYLKHRSHSVMVTLLEWGRHRCRHRNRRPHRLRSTLRRRRGRSRDSRVTWRALPRQL